MKPNRILAILAVGVAGLVGCSQQQTATSEEPRIMEQTVALSPESVPVTIGPLSGELSNLSVMRRVDAADGSVVYPPQLTGTLTLRNTSEDVAVRLIGGEMTYVGDDGARLDLGADRTDTAFTFPSYSVDRLDPGAETRQSLDVPFPAAAFEGGLKELRFGLEYVPMPYRVESVTVEMAVGARG